jgi:hypothetical protein
MKRRGVVNNALTHWPDISPTVLEWMAACAVEQHGCSLLPILSRKVRPAATNSSSRTISRDQLLPDAGIRTRTHKYVRFVSRAGDAAAE